MSDEIVKEDEENMTKEERSKFQSRKFLVWIVWLLITIIVVAGCCTVMIIVKQVLPPMTSIISEILGDFFIISMMYLGVNACQKVGLSYFESKGKK